MDGASGPEQTVSTMYVRLLEAMLSDPAIPDGPHRSHGPLAEALHARRLLDRHTIDDESVDAVRPVADHLVYDAALIHLARRRGIWCHASDFGAPALGRARIEQALAARGVDLSPTGRRGKSRNR